MDAVISSGNTIQAVFAFLLDVYQAIPDSVQYLIYCAFGGMVLIAIMRGIGR